MRRIASLAVAFTGVYVLLLGVQGLLSSTWVIPSLLTDPGNGEWVSIGLFFLSIAMYFVVGFLLVAKRDALAARLADDTDATFVAEPRPLLRVALIVFGLILVVFGLGAVLSALGSWIGTQAQTSAWDQQYTDPYQTWSLITGGVVGGIKIGLGAWFLVGSERLASRLWSGPQTPAVPAEESRSAACPSCGAEFNPDDYRDPSQARCGECGAPLFR